MKKLEDEISRISISLKLSGSCKPADERALHQAGARPPYSAEIHQPAAPRQLAVEDFNGKWL